MKLVVSLALVSLAASIAPAQIVQQLDAIAGAGVLGNRAVGIVAAVVKGKDTLLLKAYGKADVEADVPMTVDTVIPIGSITKQFTAAAIVQLRDQGKLSLDDDLTKWLPDFDTRGNKVTLRHLLGHTAGIVNLGEMPELRAMQLIRNPKVTRDEVYKVVSRYPFQFPTGTMQIYSNSGYWLLGLIIEKASGMTYEDYVEKRIFEPLGMSRSMYCNNSEDVPRRAHGYGMKGGKTGRVTPIVHTATFAAGAICSTAGDMITWLQALHGGKVLTPKSYAEMIAPSKLNDGTPLRYAMGTIVAEDSRGIRYIGHSGGGFGFSSVANWYPDGQLAIVVLTNSEPDEIEVVTENLAAAMLPVPPSAGPFKGDAASLVGTYRGLGPGGDVVVEVTQTPAGVAFSIRGAPASPLPWVEGWTFRRGSTLLTFRRSGNSGPATELLFDTAGDSFILRRQPQPAQLARFTGKWDGTVDFLRPNGTIADSDPIQFNLTQEDHQLTGTLGGGAEQWKVENGVVNDGNATFEAKDPDGSLLKFTVTITKDKLEGEVQILRDGVVRVTGKIAATKSSGAGASAPVLRVGEVVRVAELNTRQIRALDRDRTVVLLQGGMLEEHGPYLPAFTDGILSDRLTLEVANGVVAKKPEWTALLFPPVSVGASGYNEIGGHFVFPGTYAVRPATLKAIYMDLASQLGEQGFKWIMVIHVHGSPLHIAALDEAGDFFRDTYSGRMVNLWGLLPVIGGWGSGMSGMPAAWQKEDGVSLHGGLDEHSLMLHLQPNLVAADYQQASTITGSSYVESVAAARQKDWPGYLGAPRLATAALGLRIWTSFAGTALKTTLEILDGADPAKYPRYLPLMATNPPYQAWIAAATDRDRALGKQQESWTARRQEDAVGSAAAQLATLEAAWNKAHLTNDAAAFDRLWADDIVVFVPRTRPMTKAEALAAFKDGTTTFTRFETADVHPRVTGDLAVVTGRVQVTRTVSGRAASENWHFRKVYRRAATGWRVISYHAWAPQ